MAFAAPSSAAVGGMVVVAGLPSTTTDTVEVCPSTVSVEVQTAPAGMGLYSCEYTPGGLRAGMTKSGVTVAAVSVHSVWMVTAPWVPASVPAMVLVTSS